MTERDVVRVLRREAVDVVLAQYGTMGAEVVDACRATGTPLVVQFHGYDASRGDILASRKLAYAKIFEFAASVVAVSSAMAERLVSLGADRQRVVHIPCGVDCSMFVGADPAHAPPTLVGVGRFVEKKGPHLTLLAFARATLRVPNARLVLAGDGPLREACLRMAKALGLADRAEMPGVVTHGEALRLMRGARAFVQHSIVGSSGDREGTPVAVMEASACGLPVIATRHEGIRDVVVEGRTGELVDEMDVDGMAVHMQRALLDGEWAAALGRNGAELVRAHHTLDQSIDKLRAVLHAAALTRRPAGARLGGDAR